MDAYFKQREQLILEDRALRVDHLGAINATSAEKQADRIIRDIRSAEAASVWGVGSFDIEKHQLGAKVTNLFPGMAFLTGFWQFSLIQYRGVLTGLVNV